MGKASSNKKVARAAGTGGGRTAGVQRPYGWYSVLAVVVALGVFLIAFSRNEQQALAAIHPRGSDHWHAAYGIDICGRFQPNLPQNSNLTVAPAPGLHTHGDGLIHIEPFVSAQSADAGTHATLARFAATYPGFRLTSNLIQYPGGKVYKNGDKCGTKVADVRIRVWQKATGATSITYTNPSDVRVKDGMAITVAFLSVNDDIPKPPQAALDALNKPNTKEPNATAPVTTLPIAVPTTTNGTATTTKSTATTSKSTASTTKATPAATAPPTSASSAPPTSHP